MLSHVVSANRRSNHTIPVLAGQHWLLIPPRIPIGWPGWPSCWLSTKQTEYLAEMLQATPCTPAEKSSAHGRCQECFRHARHTLYLEQYTGSPERSDTNIKQPIWHFFKLETCSCNRFIRHWHCVCSCDCDSILSYLCNFMHDICCVSRYSRYSV